MKTFFKRSFKAEKEVIYLSGDAAQKLTAKKEKQQANYQAKSDTLTEKYVALGEKMTERSRWRVKKLFRLSRQLQHIKIKRQHTEHDLTLLMEGRYIALSPYQRFRKWFSQIPYGKQKTIFGLVFLLPWMIGFAVFFFPAMVRTIWWSLHDVEPIGAEIITKFVGFRNYTELFSEYVIDGNRIFQVELLMFAQDLAINLPIILIFSLFIAVMLNKPFKGHNFVKAVFFIPVIFNFTVIADTLTRGFGVHLDSSLSSNIRITEELATFLLSTGLGTSFITIVINSVDRIFTIVNFSGIQILIFVAALQSIPKHLYEAALVEGSTKYETFWKITLPMVTPVLVTAAVYTVIDSFTRAPIYRFLTYAQVSSRYGLASSIAMSYFLINLAIIIIVLGFLKGLVFHYDDK